MWRLTSRFFIGMFASAMATNAAAVYLLHDVDADRIGKWNLAYWELTLEFFVFSLVLAVLFFLLTWIGTVAFGLRHGPLNSADAFLLGYLVLSPLCCAAIVLLNSHKRRTPN